MRGELKTERDFVNRKGRMNKTKIKVSVRWFDKDSQIEDGLKSGDRPADKSEKENEKKEGEEAEREGEEEEGELEGGEKKANGVTGEGDLTEEGTGKKKRGRKKKMKNEDEESDKNTFMIHCNQEARSFTCPVCEESVRHKFVSYTSAFSALTN